MLLVTFKLQFQDGNSPTPNSSLGKWNHGGCLQNECKLRYSKVFTEPKGYSFGIIRSAWNSETYCEYRVINVSLTVQVRGTENWHKAQVKCTRTDQLEIDWRSYGLPVLYCSDSEGWWSSTWSGTYSCFLDSILLKRATEHMSCKIFFPALYSLK